MVPIIIFVLKGSKQYNQVEEEPASRDDMLADYVDDLVMNQITPWNISYLK